MSYYLSLILLVGANVKSGISGEVLAFLNTSQLNENECSSSKEHLGKNGSLVNILYVIF